MKYYECKDVNGNVYEYRTKETKISNLNRYYYSIVPVSPDEFTISKISRVKGTTSSLKLSTVSTLEAAKAVIAELRKE